MTIYEQIEISIAEGQLKDFAEDLMHELGKRGIVPMTPKPNRQETALMVKLRAQPGWEEMLTDEHERAGILRWVIEGAVLAQGTK